jgi:FtsP/CotA-like multicopper oxidase with cupredoxin domain
MRRTGGKSVAVVIGLAALAGSIPTVAQVGAGAPPVQVCESPDRSISLFAEKLGRNRYGYGLRPGGATIPGPTLEMHEDECLAVTLVNDADKRLSLHAHGVSYTVASDGTPLNGGCVRPGRARTYVFSTHAASTRVNGTVKPSSAGYWHYHDHCMSGVHGTAGIKAGLFGAFVVRKPSDPRPDRPPFVVVMGPNSTINLRKAPRTPTFRATQGEQVEFIVIAHGDDFHTFHLHAHRWADNRTGIPESVGDPEQIIDNKTAGPADSFGFQIVAGEDVGPGAWMYHCHVQGHADAGMAGLFVVEASDGQVTPAARKAVRGFRREHSSAHH